MPQVAQQDYIYVHIADPIESGIEFTDEAVRTLYRCARNGSILDVVLVSDFQPAKARVISADFDGEYLVIAVYSRNEGQVINYIFESEPEPQTEEE